MKNVYISFIMMCVLGTVMGCSLTFGTGDDAPPTFSIATIRAGSHDSITIKISELVSLEKESSELKNEFTIKYKENPFGDATTIAVTNVSFILSTFVLEFNETSFKAGAAVEVTINADIVSDTDNDLNSYTKIVKTIE